MKTCMNIEFKVKKFKLFFKNIKENGDSIVKPILKYTL